MDEVSLDDPELADKLKIMRATAASLENGKMSTKLVIPNSQILYTQVDAPGPTDDERRAQILEQLEGMTPYAVEELTFDWVATSDGCRVAAVAKETLKEAEAFAVEHKFNPVSLVATPQNGTFTGEPYFGLADSAFSVLDSDDTVERDLEAIVVLGADPGVAAPAPKAPEPAPADPDPRAEDKAAAPTPPPAVEKKPVLRAEKPGGPSFQTRRSAEDPAGGRREPMVSATPSRISFVPVDSPPEPAGPVTAPLPPLPKRPKTPLPESAAERPIEFAIAPPSDAEPEAPKQGLAAKRAPAGDTALPSSEEAEALTIFGARKAGKARGKPRFLGLILTVLLLLFLAIVAFGSSYFLDGGIAGLLEDDIVAEEPAVATLTPEVSEAIEDEENLVTASLTPEEGSPILRAPLEETPESQTIVRPAPAEVAPAPRLPDLQTARSFYAATGIWQLPPKDFQNPETEAVLDDLYIASIDPASLSHDAVALPGIDPIEDVPPQAAIAPAPFGTLFALDDDGLVLATPEGALTPGGAIVFAGRPAVTPPEKPTPPASALPEEEVAVAEAPSVRPKSRPSNLIEANERRRFGGLSLAELEKRRPLARPASPQTEPTVDETPTALAVASSRSPRLRPPNFAKVVEAARARTPEPQVETASVAPQSIAPKIPTRASVARRATVTNAINLKRVNLIGVYGTPSARRALVRLPSGRYVKVSVGDRVDGGKVAAISESELRYVKSGKNITLKMPRS